MAAQQVSHYLPDVIQTAANDLAEFYGVTQSWSAICGDRGLGVNRSHAPLTLQRIRGSTRMRYINLLLLTYLLTSCIQCIVSSNGDYKY